VTVRHDLHALSKFFKFAIKQNWCSNSPVLTEDIPSDKDAVRMHILTDEEEAEYFEMTKTRFPKLHDIAKVIVLQGCRPEEVLSLELSHVDLKKGKIRIVDGKSTAAKRTLKLRPETLAILSTRFEKAVGQYLFAAERDPRRKLSESTMETQFARLDLPYVMYDFRHTFATRAANAGMPLATLARILGHANLRSVQRYLHPSQQDMDRAMDALG
jgi:integrase